MANDSDQPATKGDLEQVRDEVKCDMVALELRMDTKLETVKDEILRAFQVFGEELRHDMAGANADEISELDSRVTRIEEHLDLKTP